MKNQKASDASSEYHLLFQAGGSRARSVSPGRGHAYFIFRSKHRQLDSDFVYAHVNQKKFIRQVSVSTD